MSDEFQNKCKFLGVIIDDKFTWQEHINYINNKLSKSLGILHRVKYFLDESSLFDVV